MDVAIEQKCLVGCKSLVPVGRGAGIDEYIGCCAAVKAQEKVYGSLLTALEIDRFHIDVMHIAINPFQAVSQFIYPVIIKRVIVFQKLGVTYLPGNVKKGRFCNFLTHPLGGGSKSRPVGKLKQYIGLFSGMINFLNIRLGGREA